MRLLERDSNGEFSLTKDLVNNLPAYAILSHTWGEDDEEVTFQDLTARSGKSKAGYQKIQFCGEQAHRDGLRYFWVDTCCIKKSDAAELQKSINSMFRWYKNAAKCYVYLSDVSMPDDEVESHSKIDFESAFRTAKWFTRGWTLQELLAPSSVEFFSTDYKRLGDKFSLERLIHEKTGIPVEALHGYDPTKFSVDERVSWVAKRETKHEEDMAYSLLGIFGVFLPLIYGEGRENAFSRLHEEICRRLRRHQPDELSTTSQATFNSSKRLKTTHSQSSSVPSRRDPNFLYPEPPFYSEYSLPGDNSPETGKELVTSIDATTKQSLIDQLYFTKIDERLTSLTAAQGTTCRWFLTKPEFISWHDRAQQPVHGGFLWIKGNPGTGKSTLMKLLFEEAKLNTKGNSLQITLSFFFLARGTVEEKSTEGLYRSLLHQLFEKAEELRDSLEWMTADGARGIERNGWNDEALKQSLAHAIQKLGARSLMIFVDALDECDTDQTAGMVCFFEELCDRAGDAQVRLQICFSSRHYPTVVIQKGLEVTLEDEVGHTEDIKHYIKSKLRLGKSKQAESLRSEILEKSSSIFLWVVLVLDILNSEYPDSSVSTKKIRERLKEIPPRLSDLFEIILSRDGKNLERLQLCLKWILFTTRPLTPQELYFAIHLGLNKECSGCWDQEDVDLDQIKAFVRSSSKGLAEVTRNKASEVQFIHESVRDFLMSKYEGQWSGASGNFVGHSHEILRDCCLAQLNALISQDVNILNPLLKASKAEAKQFRETISLKFPFLRYSVLNVLYHANGTQQSTIVQRHFLADFPLQQWIFLNNALEKFDTRRYTESVSLLYILAEKNLANLIRIHPQAESCFDVENERYRMPILAALVTGSHKAVQTFLEVQAEIQPQEPLLRHLCKQYSENRNKPDIFSRNFTFSRQKGVFSYIAEQGDEIILTFFCALGKLDVESKDSHGQTPLSWAAARGHEAVVKLLLEKGAELNTKGNSGQTPLSWAAARGHEAVVKLLLEKGAELETSDYYSGQTPLLWAVEKGHEAVVKLLLEKGAELNTKGNSGQTPLLWAAEKGHEAVVKLLLEKGAKLKTKSNSDRTPLSLAAENGHEAVVKLLLEKGAELETKDSNGQTPLSWAVAREHEAVVKLLLEKGAKLETKDSNGQTPLSLAAAREHEAVVKLLLEKGAEPETKDNFSRTPLSLAAGNNREAAVKLLLEKGAKLETKGNSNQTPLSQAARRGHKAVVKLLLDKGAELETKDYCNQTPLSLVAENGHEAVVKLLLEKGAKLETKDSNGQTPLLWAAARGHEAVVKLLLEKGAELETKDNFDRTPLSWAVAREHEAVVKLLLDKGAELETKDNSGRTPLSLAAEKGREAVVKLLLEKGAKQQQ